MLLQESRSHSCVQSIRNTWSLDLDASDEIVSIGALIFIDRKPTPSTNFNLFLRQFAIVKQGYDSDTVIKWQKQI